MKLQKLFQVPLIVGVLLLSVAVAPTMAQVTSAPAPGTSVPAPGTSTPAPGSLPVSPLIDATIGVAPTTAQVTRDLEPGSLLVFPLFDATTGHVTQIRVTDTNDGPFGTASVRLHYNVVCAGTKAGAPCSARNFTRLITYHGTVVINIPTDVAIPAGCPDMQGFVVVWATGTGAATAPGGAAGLNKPISYNNLIGSAHVTSGTPVVTAAAQTGISFQSPMATGTVLGGSPANRALQFGIDYSAPAETLFTDFRALSVPLAPPAPPVPPAPISSDLVLLALDINAGNENPPTQVTVEFWDDLENPYSTEIEFVCWIRIPLTKIDPFFDAALLGRPSGSLRLAAQANCPISGFCPPIPLYQPAILGAILENYGTPEAAVAGRRLYHDSIPHPTTYTAE